MKLLQLILAIVVTLAALLSGSTRALANNPADKQIGHGGDPYRRHEASCANVGEAQDLPNLPRYAGEAKFTYGSICKNARGGPVYSMSYAAKEDAAAVIGWYDQTLAALKWDIDKEARRGGYLAATDGSG